MNPLDEAPKEPAPSSNLLDTPVEELLLLQDGLERWLDLPGTLPIHDALHELRRAVTARDAVASDAALAGLGGCLAEFPTHPVAGELRGRFGFPAPTLERRLPSITEIPDLPLRDDPLEALVENAGRQAEIRHLLESRIGELSNRVARLDQVVNMMGAALVILFALSLIGWSAAFGLFSLPGPEATRDAGSATAAGTKNGSPPAARTGAQPAAPYPPAPQKPPAPKENSR
jgi:hypothetical protein